MKKYALEITVFVTGASIMIFEIVGSRLLAPYVGSTILVWTSLIGIILASLSVGYWLGGKLADKNPSFRVLSIILVAASIFLFLTALFNNQILLLIDESFTDIRFAAFFSSTVLFTPASLMLGMVSPYAIRLKLKSLKKAGRVSGNLIALSTAGSILGTFASGFYLLGQLGSIEIVYLLSAASFLNAVYIYIAFVNGKLKTFALFSAVFLLGILIGRSAQKKVPGTIYDTDTNYNRIIVEKEVNFFGHGDIRTLRTGKLRQSGKFLDTDELAFEYTKYYRLGNHFNPDIKNALMIGGGGFSYPMDFLKKNPDANLDVVEIDPGMTDVAKKYFDLKENPRLTIYHQDARRFLNKTDKVYDAVYIDAFAYDKAPPFQLTTLEAVERINSMLSKDGVVILNAPGSLKGEAGRFIGAEYKTYKKIFKKVLVLPVYSLENINQLQNIMLIAVKSNNLSLISNDDEIQSYLNHIYEGALNLTFPILTDNFAPVEYLMITADIN